jgi:hypothetical protein
LKIWFFFIIVFKKIPKNTIFFFTLRIFSDNIPIIILHFFLCTAKASAHFLPLRPPLFFAWVRALPKPRQKNAKGGGPRLRLGPFFCLRLGFASAVGCFAFFCSAQRGVPPRQKKAEAKKSVVVCRGQGLLRRGSGGIAKSVEQQE